MNKKLNVVIIGAGNIASGYDYPASRLVLTHAHAIGISKSYRLLGFCDVNSDRAKEAALKWKTKVITDIENLDSKPDIICCAVPDDNHFDILKKCCEYDTIKAVICEKPITKSSLQAKYLVDVYKQKGIPLWVNYTRRFLNEFVELKNWIENAGNLITANCFYGKGIFHNCSHMINILEFLVGFLELSSTGNVLYDYFEDDPSVEFQLKTKTGKIFFYPVPCSIVTVFEFDLIFSFGRIKYSDATGLIEYYVIAESPIYKNELNYILYKSVKVMNGAALQNLYENIYATLNSQEKNCSSGETAYRTVCLCEKIRRDTMENKDES